MNIFQIIADELNVKTSQVESAVKLIDDGNTIPFIARYRKEATGGLSDEDLRTLFDRLNYLRNLETRKDEVKNSIEEQGKLTDEIVKALENAQILAEVEDIYRPYKQKKRTRAIIAKEKGLEPLADVLIKQDKNVNIEDIAKQYIDEEKGVTTIEEAIEGAKDIIAENISDNPEYRKEIKKYCYKEGIIATESNAKNEEEENKTYQMYFDFNESIKRIPSHRILAINRAEKENAINPGIEVAKIATDIAIGVGTAKIVDSIVNDAIPDNIKWPVRICIGLSSAVLGSMLTDVQIDYIKKKIATFKNAVDSVSSEIEKQKNTDQEATQENKGE
jgi:uncharacterized protein